MTFKYGRAAYLNQQDTSFIWYQEDDTKMDLEEYVWRVWTECMWLGIGSSGGFLRTCY